MSKTVRDNTLNNINLHALLKNFNEKYEGLYEGAIKVNDYQDLVKRGDAFVSRNNDFVGEFNRIRNDILSSDREVAALVLALEDKWVKITADGTATKKRRKSTGTMEGVKFNVIVKDHNGNILTDDDLRHTTITNPLYYKNMDAINSRIEKEYGIKCSCGGAK